MISKAAALWAASGLAVASAGSAIVFGLASADGRPAPIAGSVTSSASGNGAGGGNNGNGKGNGAAGNPGHPITVSWAINDALLPGTQRMLTTTITNPNNQAIKVTKVNAQILGVTNAGCATSWLSIGSFSGAQAILANSAGTVGLPITLDDRGVGVNQDACKLASYSIKVTATAEQA